MNKAASLSILCILLGSIDAALAQQPKQYSVVGPWTVMKRPDGPCSAVAQGFHGDYFVLKLRSTEASLTLVNSKFNIPAGQYPLGLKLNGTTIVPADEGNFTGTVESGKQKGITVKLAGHHLENLPKAALLTIALAGRDHLLFLSDTAGMMRALFTCAKNESDPLKTAR